MKQFSNKYETNISAFKPFGYTDMRSDLNYATCIKDYKLQE